MKAIEIKNLCKSYGDVKAVNDLSFSVNEGELFAFLGVNGAGKSTTINVISGTLKKDSGTVIIDGHDIDSNPDAAKTSIGIVFQSSLLDKSLSVRDNLTHRASLYGIFGEELEKRLGDLSDLLSLSEILSRPVSKLSGGQRRRIDIARALICNPKILILDEPTTGLDPMTRKTIWEVISKLRVERGMTVLLTTHYMEEAADADFVVVIDGGKRIAEGTPIDLKNSYTSDTVMLYNVNESELERLGEPYTAVGGGYRISVENTARATELITKFPEIFTDYEVIKGKMDDVFLNVTGKSLTEDGGDKK